MKTNEEMVASLLMRRDTYEKEHKRAVKRWGTVAACACLVAALGVGVWRMQPDTMAGGDLLTDEGGISDMSGTVEQFAAKTEQAEQDIACLKEKGSFEVDGDQLGVLVYNQEKYMQSFIDVDGEVVKGDYLGDTGDFEGGYYHPGDGQVYLLKDYPDTLYIELTNGGHVFLTVYDGGEPVPKSEDVDSDTYSRYLAEITSRDWPAWYGGSFLDGGKLYVYVTEETDEVKAEAYEMFGECELLWGKYEYEYLTMLIAEISDGMTDGVFPTISYACVLDAENCVEVCFSRESPEAQKQIERMDDVGGAIRFRVVSGTTLAYTEDVETK